MKLITRTEDEIELLRQMQKEHRRTGHPEKSAAIQRAIDEGVELDRSLVIASLVDPANAKSLSDYVPPPRRGRGSGTDEWRDFAYAVTDIDEDVVNRMNREDIIAFLEDEGVIERED